MYACITGAGCATLTYTRCAAPARRAASTDARIDGRSTRWNSAAFDGDGCGVPTRCTIVSAAVTADANVDASSALPTTVVAPAGARPADSALTSARTRWPRAS